MGLDIDSVADSLWAAQQQGRHMPDEWHRKLTLDNAYPVQLAMLRKRLQAGERQAGWKVGLTSAAMRAQQGIESPCMGYLLESGRRIAPASIPFDSLITPGIEMELCVQLRSTLRGPGVTAEAAAAAIAVIHPAFEVVEVRGNFGADLPLAVADNVQQKAFVTGPGLAIPNAEAALAALSQAQLTLTRNGVECTRADSSEVMGNPAHSLAWLANFLSRWDLAVEAGMFVMTGSFTKQFPVVKGDRFEAVFDPIGSVQAVFP